MLRFAVLLLGTALAACTGTGVNTLIGSVHPQPLFAQPLRMMPVQPLVGEEQHVLFPMNEPLAGTDVPEKEKCSEKYVFSKMFNKCLPVSGTDGYVGDARSAGEMGKAKEVGGGGESEPQSLVGGENAWETQRTRYLPIMRATCPPGYSLIPGQLKCALSNIQPVRGGFRGQRFHRFSDDDESPMHSTIPPFRRFHRFRPPMMRRMRCPKTGADTPTINIPVVVLVLPPTTVTGGRNATNLSAGRMFRPQVQPKPSAGSTKPTTADKPSATISGQSSATNPSAEEKPIATTKPAAEKKPEASKPSAEESKPAEKAPSAEKEAAAKPEAANSSAAENESKASADNESNAEFDSATAKAGSTEEASSADKANESTRGADTSVNIPNAKFIFRE